MSGKNQYQFAEDQQIIINETLKLQQFKSIFASIIHLIEKQDYNQSESRTLTLSKLIIQLDEDICFKRRPYMKCNFISPHLQSSRATFNELAKQAINVFSFNCTKSSIKGFDDSCRTVEFTPKFGTKLYGFLSHLNGLQTITDIASQFSISAKEVLHLLQPLYETGFLILCSKSLVPASTFYIHLMNTERDYRVKSLQNPNVNNHDDLEYLKDVLIQNLFALYHYVSAFPEHLGEAISHISNQELKEKLCNTLTGNYWHSNMLLKGLMELGYSKEQVKQTSPIPATLGVINYLRWLAKTDLFSYAACLGLTEYPEVSEETAHTISNYIQAEWDSIELLNLLPKEALEYFRKYKKIDYMKARISKDFFDAETYLTPERQAEIQSRVRVYIECQKAEILAIIQRSQVIAA
ncbi:hypothetical protein IM40_02380 [Candidatus Paracaedimonas acanthamoebae]|nr:hypothetical protein IM40_02380 [Candidatus Paracaedimonas acanthamoebae]